MFYILRRTGLGLGSTKAIKELSQHEITVVRNNKLPEFTDDDVVLRWGTTANLIEQPPLCREMMGRWVLTLDLLVMLYRIQT